MLQTHPTLPRTIVRGRVAEEATALCAELGEERDGGQTEAWAKDSLKKREWMDVSSIRDLALCVSLNQLLLPMTLCCGLNGSQIVWFRYDLKPCIVTFTESRKGRKDEKRTVNCMNLFFKQTPRYVRVQDRRGLARH